MARRVLANTRRGDQRRLALADRLRAEVVEVVAPREEGASDVELALAARRDERPPLTAAPPTPSTTQHRDQTAPAWASPRTSATES